MLFLISHQCICQTNQGKNHHMVHVYCMRICCSMHPLEKIGLPLQEHRYGTSVWMKSVWFVSYFQESYGHHLRNSPPLSWKLGSAFSFRRSTSQLCPSRTSTWCSSSKFFSPNGLIAKLSGPYEGKRHDSTMLYESGVLPNLRRDAFYNNEPLCVYGDPAYPFGVHLHGPFKDRQLTPQMQACNICSSTTFFNWIFLVTFVIQYIENCVLKIINMIKMNKAI